VSFGHQPLTCCWAERCQHFLPPLASPAPSPKCSTRAEHFQDTGFDVVHFTSAISAPAFAAGANYTGHNPPLLAQKDLRAYVHEYLGRELGEILPEALIISLGAVAAEAVSVLVAEQRIDEVRCVSGFPHPSDANGWRVRIFERNRTAMLDKVRGWFEAERRRDTCPG
jgi:hypothetical protein